MSNPNAIIHVAKSQLGLDDDAYRAILVRVTGKASSRGLDTAGRAKLLKEFERLGFKKRAAAKPSPKPVVRKVFALWGELARKGIVRDGSRRALRAFVARVTKVEDPEWLEPKQAIQVIEALKAMEARG